MKLPDNKLIESLTEKDKIITFKTLQIINYKSAYGHNPDICAASAKLMQLLNNEEFDKCCTDITSNESIDAILKYCHNSKNQLEYYNENDNSKNGTGND
jgi:hypothetical protein